MIGSRGTLMLLLSGVFWVSPVLSQGNPLPVASPAPPPAPAPTSASAGTQDNPMHFEKPSEVALKVRDPFKRMINLEPSNEAPKSDLEAYAVEQFKLIGVITGPSRLRAMVMAPNGKTYMVRERMKIGSRKGVITKITTRTVFVREKVINVLGEEESVSAEIKMQEGASIAGG